MSDFFPRRESELLEWLENFSTVLLANASAWDIPLADATNLTMDIKDCVTVYKLAKGENGTKALIFEKNERLKVVKAATRKIKNKYIDHNDVVTNVMRERLGLPIRKRSRSLKPVPIDIPILEVIPINNRQHLLKALNPSDGKKRKPEKTEKVRYVSEIRDIAPTNAGELRHSVSRRKTTTLFIYNESDRGKRVFYSACYENSKGDLGPWGDIIEAIIP